MPRLGLVILLLCWSGLAAAAPLDDYVTRPDGIYQWSMYHHSRGILADYYFLKLQSQQWLDEKSVDRPVWTHEVRIAHPRAIFCGETARTSRDAVLIVSGGRNKPDGELGTGMPLQAGIIARAFCRPVVELRQVPNEPLVFTDEQSPRKEDAIIAYSLDRYLRGEPGDWPVQLAMVRAAVQGMTAIQEFSRTRDEMPDVDGFVLIGASKRGWTVWLTAAVDPRVRAVVPVSIDVSDMGRQFAHHFAAYGEYAPALRDYKAFDIACRMAGGRGRELMSIIDPVAYNDRLTMPKLILNSAGDQFFVSDSWRFYFDNLPGPKQLRYTVNSDHGHGNLFVRLMLFMQVRNWVNDVLAGREPPSVGWRREEDGTLVIKTNRRPRQMLLWTADNPKARDFRLETLGPEWRSRPVRPGPDGVYRVRVDAPREGWRAAVAEATFGGDDADEQQIYTTGVYVTPDTLPYVGNPCTPNLARKDGAEFAAVSAPAGDTSTDSSMEMAE